MEIFPSGDSSRRSTVNPACSTARTAREASLCRKRTTLFSVILVCLYTSAVLEHLLGAVMVRIAARQFVQSREHARRGPRRPSGVMRGGRTMHEPLTLLGREVESIVPELVKDEVAKPLGVFEITSVAAGFIEVDERVSQKRVVVEEARHLGRAV